MTGDNATTGATRLPLTFRRSIGTVKAGLFVGALSLAAGLSLAGSSAARADTIVTLEGVTFADGGTASGYFELNSYGYLEFADITTSSGTTADNVAIPGFTYITSGALVNNSVPFDSGFYFNSTVDAFSLALTADNPVTDGGLDPLVLGAGSPGSFTGSVEDCQQNASACGGPTYLDGRLVSAGSLYVPEPTTLSLLGMGFLMLAAVRRRRAGARAVALG
jgi:hypothetical protein